MKALRGLVWLAGAALSATMIVGAIHGGWLPADEAIAGYAAALLAITIGLVVWQVRPESRTGILLTAVPFASMLSDLKVVYPPSRCSSVSSCAPRRAGGASCSRLRLPVASLSSNSACR